MWYKHSKHAVHFSEILDELKKKMHFCGSVRFYGVLVGAYDCWEKYSQYLTQIQ